MQNVRKIADVYPKIASPQYDLKITKSGVFPKKFLKRIFLENATFFLIPSNFDASRRSISEHFHVFRRKFVPGTKSGVETENWSFLGKKVKKFLKKSDQKVPQIFSILTYFDAARRVVTEHF